MKKKIPVYNDGFLYICDEVSADTDFGAVKNSKKIADVKKIQKMAFKEMSKRDEDMTFAESEGHSLSLKVKMRICPKMDNKKHVMIEKTLYSAYKIDESREKQEMYLYLEKVRDLK